MSPRVPGAGLAILIAATALAQEPKEEAPLMAPPPEVSLTGHWTLDPKLSDDPGHKVREAMKGMQGDSRRRRPPIFPGPGGFPDDRREPAVPTGPGIDITTPGMTGTDGTGDPFKRGGSSRSSGSQSRAAFDHVQNLPETLTIAQRPTLILVKADDDEGRIRALRPDGTRQRATNGESEHRTRWDKGLLRVDTWHDDGVHAEEIFDLAPDRSLLTVTVRVDDGDSTISLERVFRPDAQAES